MKKILITLAAVFVVGGGIYAYTLTQDKDNESASDSTPQTSQTAVVDTEQQAANAPVNTAEGAIDKLKAAGLSVGDDEGAFYQMIGATSGVKVDINGSTVEIYGFDDNAALESAKSSLEGSQKISEVLVLIHDNDSLYTEVKGVLEK